MYLDEDSFVGESNDCNLILVGFRVFVLFDSDFLTVNVYLRVATATNWFHCYINTLSLSGWRGNYNFNFLIVGSLATLAGEDNVVFKFMFELIFN